MTNIELIYDSDCPNVSQTRAQLLRAFGVAKQPAHWVEWDRSDSASPPHVKGFGSPTILVDGHDVAGAPASDDANCCRLYADEAGRMSGVPSVAAIVSSLQAADAKSDPHERPRRAGWLSSMAVLPGLGATLMPVGLCPACWPAYAGVLSALGLGFLLESFYLLPVTITFLLFAVGALAFRAGSRRGRGPFAVGLVASALILLGKFVFVSVAALYSGIALLLGASIWNAWPRKRTDLKHVGACPACAPAETAPDSTQWEQQG